MRWLSSLSLTSWRDVPAAEAWPPSSELGQTTPRMIVPVISPRGLLLVPSRSFAFGLLLACRADGQAFAVKEPRGPPSSTIPTKRRVESFADNLNMRQGIVSGRVALLP